MVNLDTLETIHLGQENWEDGDRIDLIGEEEDEEEKVLDPDDSKEEEEDEEDEM